MCWAIGFDEASFDESKYARAMAHYIGSEHHSARFTAGHASRAWPEVASHLDEPMADASLLPTQNCYVGSHGAMSRLCSAGTVPTSCSQSSR